MRLDLVRSGGFANLRVPAHLDTSELSPGEAEEIEALVGQVNLASLAERSPLRGRGADRFQYDLKVVRGEEEHRVIASEGEVSPELRALIDTVMARGATSRGSPPGSEGKKR